MDPEVNFDPRQVRAMEALVSRHKRRNAWTIGELEILKHGFKSGKRIKTIAYEIGRSMTAVNKFISRSGLERNRKSRSRR
ncbi:MAG: hypothetical protein LBC25_00950 [Holosporales bacterium]|jgi:hypothetical protein|nr:hypothetical protein [Holosporales bacterium]